MYSEWELLVTSEAIEPGDCVTVETESGDEESMIFVRLKNKTVVELLDVRGDRHFFSAITLESDDNSFITGRSEEKMSARQILKRKNK